MLIFNDKILYTPIRYLIFVAATQRKTNVELNSCDQFLKFKVCDV